MLNENDLDCFADQFMGYGNPNAKVWFIGMEEGGGNSLQDIQNRLIAWKVSGSKAFEDVAKFHEAIGLPDLFKFPGTKAQRTWSKLIEVYLFKNEMPVETSNIRQYQAHKWGREGGETCLMELLPLPCPNLNTWHYTSFSRDPKFSTRTEYRKAFLNQRIFKIGNLIREFKPENVVFYGKSYEAYWLEIIQQVSDKTLVWNDENEADFKTCWNSHTLFLSTKHPTSRPSPGSSYFQKIGARMADHKQ